MAVVPFQYVGSKNQLINISAGRQFFPPPRHDLLIELCCGAAAYSCKHIDSVKKIHLIDQNSVVCSIWTYLSTTSKAKILDLPILQEGDNLTDYKLAKAEKWLISMNLRSCGNHTTPSHYKMQKNSNWTSDFRDKLAASIPKFKKIKVFHMSWAKYCERHVISATYFIDPPYQLKSGGYTHGSDDFDYEALGKAIERKLKGQIIITEGALEDDHGNAGEIPPWIQRFGPEAIYYRKKSRFWEIRALVDTDKSPIAGILGHQMSGDIGNIKFKVRRRDGTEDLGVSYANIGESKLLKKYLEEHEIYAVEEIVNHRGNGVRREYLISWVGYEESENSWEKNVACGPLKSQYDRRIARQRQRERASAGKILKKKKKCRSKQRAAFPPPQISLVKKRRSRRLKENIFRQAKRQRIVIDLTQDGD